MPEGINNLPGLLDFHHQISNSSNARSDFGKASALLRKSCLFPWDPKWENDDGARFAGVRRSTFVFLETKILLDRRTEGLDDRRMHSCFERRRCLLVGRSQST